MAETSLNMPTQAWAWHPAGFVSGKALAAGFAGAMCTRWDRWL
ncbi:hypothetical protein LCGC14_2533530, partial [marine sediment metagenome]